MGKQFQILNKEEKDKTKSEKEMERLDYVFEQTELSLKPKRVAVIYKNKIDKKNLSYNLVMTCVWFALGFLLSGGSIWGGAIITLILAPMMEWREKDKEIEIPYDDEDDEEITNNKPNKPLSPRGQEALLKYANETGLIETPKKPVRETASREYLEKNAFKGERFVNTLNEHLVKSGQIKND